VISSPRLKCSGTTAFTIEWSMLPETSQLVTMIRTDLQTLVWGTRRSILAVATPICHCRVYIQLRESGHCIPKWGGRPSRSRSSEVPFRATICRPGRPCLSAVDGRQGPTRHPGCIQGQHLRNGTTDRVYVQLGRELKSSATCADIRNLMSKTESKAVV